MWNRWRCSSAIEPIVAHKKTPAIAGVFRGTVSRLPAPAAAEKAQNGQQVDEHVVDVEVDRQRGGDVVGFAAVDHPLHVDQHEGRENHNGHDREGQHQRRQL